MNKPECSVQRFFSGFNCAQAVFSTYSSEFGLEPELALRISSSFGGGMGYIGETCGAVTGAFMLIGLKYGKVKAEDNAAKEKTIHWFRNLPGSLQKSTVQLDVKKY